MADKKLIDNSSATTVDNFYGNKSGADVQIPLATAASVLAVQNAKGNVSFTDFNELTAMGNYRIVGIADKANKPPVNANGILEVIVGDSKSSTFKCKQIYTVAVSGYEPTTHMRVLNTDTWTEWQLVMQAPDIATFASTLAANMAKMLPPDNEDNPLGEYCWHVDFGGFQIACNYWSTAITSIKMRKYLYTTGWTPWVDIQFTQG